MIAKSVGWYPSHAVHCTHVTIYTWTSSSLFPCNSAADFDVQTSVIYMIKSSSVVRPCPALLEHRHDIANAVQAFLVAVDSSNNVQPAVSVLRGIITPDTLAPTFTFLNFTAPIIDQNTGLFSMNITLTTSVPATVYYAMYR